MWQLASSLSTNYNVSSTVRLEWSSVHTVETQDHVTPLLRDKLYWLRARERITFKLCLLVYKAINGLAPSYLQDLCVPVTTVSMHPCRPRSALHLVETLSSLVPGDVLATGHFASPVPQRGTACRQTVELLLLWLLSRIYSNSVSCAVRRPCSDFMDNINTIITIKCLKNWRRKMGWKLKVAKQIEIPVVVRRYNFQVSTHYTDLSPQTRLPQKNISEFL